MLMALLLTGQDAIGVLIGNVVLAVIGLLLLTIAFAVGAGRVPWDELRLTLIVAGALSQGMVVICLKGGRAYDLKYSGYNSSWLEDWASEMLFGVTNRGHGLGVGGAGVWLVTWALLVLCLAVPRRPSQ